MRALLPPPIFLLFAFAAWAAYEVLPALYPQPAPLSLSPAHSARPTEASAQIALPSWADKFSDTDRSRPLFTPTRRVPEPPRPVLQEPVTVPEPDPKPEPIAPPPPPPEPPNISYRGFVRTSTQVSALILDRLTGQERFVRQGDEIDGWRVEKVSEMQIDLSLQNHRAVVKLAP